MNIPKAGNSLSRHSRHHPRCADFCKFILTSVYFQRKPFNVSFFSLQKIANRQTRLLQPVPGKWRGGCEPTVLQNGLFQGAIKTVPGRDMDFMSTQKSPFHELKRALPQYIKISVKKRYSISDCMSEYYAKSENPRFFAPNGSRYAPERFFRDFRRDYLTSPAPFFVFLYSGTCRLHLVEFIP